VNAVAAALAPAFRAIAAAPKPPRFRGAPRDVQTLQAHEWMLAGPAETGKTFGGLTRLDADCRATPGMRAALVRKVRADMTGTVLGTWERVISRLGGVTTLGGGHPEAYRYANGSMVYVGGMDRPGSVLSSERDAIYVNQAEEITLEDWETLTTRCTGRGAVLAHPWLGGDCNPGPPTHWILKRPTLQVLYSRHEDNPTLYDDAGRITAQGVRSLSILDTLTGVRLERLRHGRWVAAEGVVYDTFDRSVHVLTAADVARISDGRTTLPGEWRRVCAVDFGYRNPMVVQWWAIDGEGRCYLEREIYRTGQLVEDVARRARDLTTTHLEAIIADHDAEGRATLERHWMPTQAADKTDMDGGIQLVKARLQKAQDGKPRLFILRDALMERDEELSATRKPVRTLDEFEVYQYPKDAAGRAVKEAPLKENDHGMDAMRYLVTYLDADSGLPGAGGVVRSAPRQARRF